MKRNSISLIPPRFGVLESSSLFFQDITCEVELINAEAAMKYLEFIGFQRHERPMNTSAIAHDMANDDFQFTHQGIAFDVEGNLVDGRHRLKAIMKSGKPQFMMVTRGLPKKAAAVLDTGARRTKADSASYARNQLVNKHVISGMRLLIESRHMLMTATDITTMVSMFEQPWAFIHRENVTQKFLVSPMISAFMLAWFF